MAAFLSRHRNAVLVLFAAIALAGAAALPGLTVGLLPHVSFPRIVVSAEAGDRPADRMALEITRPIEEAVRRVNGLVRVRSTTSRGSCDVSLDFRWGLDMIAAQLQVESTLAALAADLPPGFRFEVRRMDPTVFPVLGLSLRSASLSPVALRDIALYELVPLLSTIPGVAQARVLGGRTEEIEIALDPRRLDGAGMTLAEVVTAVVASNVVEAVGRLEQNEKLYLVVSDTELQGLDAIRGIILRQGPQGFLHLEDVAEVRRGERREWSRVVSGGRDAVLIDLYQQPEGSDAIAISAAVDARIAAYRERTGSAVEIERWYDQGDLVRSAASSVRDAIAVGIALAMLVLWAFLRDVRVTWIVVITVPISLAATLLLLRVLGLGLNVMTLGGMAAAVGLVIDDAIVVVEHVLRRSAEGAESAFAAAAEMLPALTGSSLATLVIFVPLAFLTGVAGAFFQALSITMASALVASWATAAFALPCLCAWLSVRDRTPPAGAPGLLERLRDAYRSLLRRVLAHPRELFAGLVPLLALGAVAWLRLGSGFLPPMDEGGFVLDYRGAPGASLTETDRLLREIERILADTPDVEAYSRRTGLQLGGGVTEVNEGDYFVRLRPPPRRDIETVMEEVRERVEQQVPALKIELAQLLADLIGDLTAVPQPIEVKLFGDDEAMIRREAARVEKALAAVAGVVDVASGLVIAGDALTLRIDRAKAEMLGIRPDELTHLARIALEGEVAATLQRGPKLVDVRLRASADALSSRGDLERLWLRTTGGTRVRVGRVSETRVVEGQPQITRENLRRMIAVTGRIAGRDLGSAMLDVRAAVERLELPAGVEAGYGGLYEEQQRSFRGLLGVLLAAVALVFLLLLFSYERFGVPVAVLAVDALAGVAVLVGLWIAGAELDVASLMGLTMIVGIASESAIFFVSGWLARGGPARGVEAILEAGEERFRPIVMTALAAIGALLPLAFGLGEGSALLRPLAIAIVSGLVATVPAVLLVLPVLLGWRALRR